jgi:hypothetical protein
MSIGGGGCLLAGRFMVNALMINHAYTSTTHIRQGYIVASSVFIPNEMSHKGINAAKQATLDFVEQGLRPSESVR